MTTLEMVALDGNVFADAAAPIVELINMAAGPLMMIVLALGTLYCIFLGAKLAKAEEPQDREKAKSALKNAIIGFLLIFVLVATMNALVKPLTDWMNDNGNTNIEIENNSSN